MDEHWNNLAAVAVTRESCIAIDALRARVAELENSLVEQGAILEAVMAALKGEEPSDFMQSFPDVSHAWWVYRLAYPKP